VIYWSPRLQADTDRQHGVPGASYDSLGYTEECINSDWAHRLMLRKQVLDFLVSNLPNFVTFPERNSAACSPQ
jgi:hypothetical protein